MYALLIGNETIIVDYIFLIFLFSMGGALFILSCMEIIYSFIILKIRNVFEKEGHCSLSLYLHSDHFFVEYDSCLTIC